MNIDDNKTQTSHFLMNEDDLFSRRFGTFRGIENNYIFEKSSFKLFQWLNNQTLNTQ